MLHLHKISDANCKLPILSAALTLWSSFVIAWMCSTHAVFKQSRSFSKAVAYNRNYYFIYFYDWMLARASTVQFSFFHRERPIQYNGCKQWRIQGGQSAMTPIQLPVQVRRSLAFFIERDQSNTMDANSGGSRGPIRP